MIDEQTTKSDTSKVMKISWEVALAYFSKNGFKPKDVRSDGIGYDMTIIKNGTNKTVEVKGTRGDGIPDAFGSEFSLDDEPKFIPDFLCLVRLNGALTSKDIVLLDNKTINQYKHKAVRVVKFNSTLKTGVKNNRIGEIIRL